MAQITDMAGLRQIVADPGPRAEAKLRDHICEQGLAFIRRSPFLMLGTIGSWGLEISQKGDLPGFVEIVDERTLFIPERSGNHLALGLGNILADPRVALALIRPGTDEVLRISGRATLHDDADLCARLSARGQPALLVIRVEVDRAAFHCVKSARRAGLWQPETWDEPAPISFGKIYADALGQPDIRDMFDRMAAERDAML